MLSKLTQTILLKTLRLAVNGLGEYASEYVFEPIVGTTRNLEIRQFQYGPSKYEQVEEIRPPNVSKSIAVVYLHGGAFTFASKTILRPYITFIAHGGYLLYNVEFPPSPEHRFPTALLSIISCLKFIRQRGVHDIVVCGDSAGGSLALMTALALRSELRDQLPMLLNDPSILTSCPHVHGVINIYGVVGHIPRDVGGIFYQLAVDSYCNHEEEPEIKCFPCMKFMPMDYIHHFTSDYPPILTLIGSQDRLKDMNLEFAQQLRERGISVDWKEYQGNYHAFMALLGSKGRAQGMSDILHWMEQLAV